MSCRDWSMSWAAIWFFVEVFVQAASYLEETVDVAVAGLGP